MNDQTKKAVLSHSSRNVTDAAYCGRSLGIYMWLWTFALLAAVPFACLDSGQGIGVFDDFRFLLLSPSKQLTDYFKLASPGAAFLNAGLCGLSCNIAIWLSGALPNAKLLAGYFLVVAHCFYGLNLVNMWPAFLGILLFCLIRKVKFADFLPTAMFSTSLAPFVSDFLFRYTLGDSFDAANPRLTFGGVLISVGFGAAVGFLLPALLPGTDQMYRGHNLFNAGLSCGLIGLCSYGLFFKTLGIDTPDIITRDNPLYRNNGEEYIRLVALFFGIVFVSTALCGFFMNGRSFRGYRALFRSDGWRVSFPERFGMPLTYINIGIYGLFILGYYLAVIFLTDGVGYSGAATGVTIAAITFSASGQTPRNVFPIALGYTVLFLAVTGISLILHRETIWTLSTQAYVSGFAFATGLCPFSGRYGLKIGVAAGMIHGMICTSTLVIHGGFVLYNGGLTSGLTALFLLPILDYYVAQKNTTAARKGLTDREK